MNFRQIRFSETQKHEKSRGLASPARSLGSVPSWVLYQWLANVKVLVHLSSLRFLHNILSNRSGTTAATAGTTTAAAGTTTATRMSAAAVTTIAATGITTVTVGRLWRAQERRIEDRRIGTAFENAALGGNGILGNRYLDEAFRTEETAGTAYTNKKL